MSGKRTAAAGASGGASNEMGAELRARIGALLATAVIRRQGLDEIGLPVGGGVAALLQAESDDPVDDLVVYLDSGDRVFVQVKRTVTLRGAPGAPLTLAIQQFGAAVHAGLRPGDRLVLACATASGQIRDLSTALARRRRAAAGAPTAKERRALSAFRHVAARRVSPESVEQILDHLLIWESDPTQGDGAGLLNARLDGIVVAPGEGGRAARELSDVVRDLARTRTGMDAPQLTEALAARKLSLGQLDPTATKVHDRPLGRAVRDVEPLTLGVHQAVDVSEADLAELPSYVTRPHDQKLEQRLLEARTSSVMAVLVGESATGKTRACWEAITRLSDDWRLWDPIPRRPSVVLEGLAAVRPRTVIWLDELQYYLWTPRSDLGERVAAGLRELLRSPERGPVVVLGTVWPSYWADLTAPPTKKDDDPQAETRGLLTGTHIEVPGAFSCAELETALDPKAGDPRVRLAASAADNGQMTQYLAGVPALLERYETAPAPARALVHAAMDARRFGHLSPMSEAFLHTAGPAYLTDAQWHAADKDWFHRAIDHLGAPCRGVRGPITQVRPRPSEPRSEDRVYVLADVLDQLGRSERTQTAPPKAFWRACLEAEILPGEVAALAGAAERHGLKRSSLRLTRKAAEAGHAPSMAQVARAAEDGGDTMEAAEWRTRAAAAGDVQSMLALVEEHKRHGELDCALEWHDRAVAATPWGMKADADLAARLAEAGRIDEAVGLILHDEEPDLRLAARLMIAQGRSAEVGPWLEGLAEQGSSNALVVLARTLYADDPARAERLLREATCAGNAEAVQVGVALFERQDREADLMGWLCAAAEQGNPEARRELAMRLSETGQLDDAIALLLPSSADSASGFDASDLHLLVGLLLTIDQSAEAVRLLEGFRADADDEAYRRASTIQQTLAQRRDSAVSEAEVLKVIFEHRSEIHAVALVLLVDVLASVERDKEASDLIQKMLGHNRGLQVELMVQCLVAAGEADSAIAELQTRALAGVFSAADRAASLMAAHGRTEEAITWLKAGVEGGGFPSGTRELETAARLLESLGRTEEARSLRSEGLEVA